MGRQLALLLSVLSLSCRAAPRPAADCLPPQCNGDSADGGWVQPTIELRGEDVLVRGAALAGERDGGFRSNDWAAMTH